MPDVGVGVSHTIDVSDEAGEDGNYDPDDFLDSGSESEDSNRSDCSGSDDLIAAMYESDQGNSDLEDYSF